MIEPLPPEGATTWTFIEWAISGIALVVASIIAWAGNLHYTVARLDRDVEALKDAMKKVATKDDVADIKADLRRLLDWALGKREPHI